jgi:uncharacterized protein (TIGR03437 family)
VPQVNVLSFLLLCSSAWAQQSGVVVKFDPSEPSIGPFPTDYLTTPNAAQKTGLNINLPKPDCTLQPSACAQVSGLNALDGFALQPRIRVTFSDAIDPTTLRAGIVFVWLDNLTSDEKGLGPSGQLTGINQVVYDPATKTAYAKPNDFFDQHRRYALVVTDAVLDAMGNPVGPDPRFTGCIESPSNSYCNILQETVRNLRDAALPGKIVAISVFTTMSATAWLEKARDLLSQAPIAYQPLGTPVKAASILSIDLKAQTGANPVTFQTLSLKIPVGTLDGVDRIAFGTYQSPNFLNAQQYIPAASLTLPSSNNKIQLHAYIPSSPMPAGGYPVVIFGHGFGSNSFATPTLIASTFAKAGFVMLAINVVGHGYGPQSVIELVQSGNVVSDFAGSGRGVDLNGDGRIDGYEGCFLSWPYPAGVADCLRQTTIDLMQLVSLVRSGVGLEASSGLKLDGSKIYYAGGSLGAMYGTMLHAVDSRVRAAALNVGGGSAVDISRWAPAFHSFAQQAVGGRIPSLLNAGSDYNENYALRNQLAKVNNVSGAIEIQDMFGELEWLQASGDPLSYAPHLTLTPLANVSAKPTLFLYDLGDQSVPNPQHSALIRAAGMFNSSTLYRADLAGPVAASVCCTLPADSHGYLADNTNPAALIISKTAQQEVAGFLASDGQTIPDANAIFKQLLGFSTSAIVFETPGRDLETLNFGTLGISIQQNLTLDQTPTIENVASATGIKASVQPNIQKGSWVAIYGSNLSDSTADWTGLIDSSGQLPTSVGGVSVTIDSKPASVYYVSPGQINVLAPDIAAGDVPVVVTTRGVSTAALKVHAGNAAPAFFQWGASQYAVTTRYPDNALVANPSIGAGFVAARPGDILTLWGTGFGPAAPVQPTGVLTSGLHNVAQTVTVMVGGTSAPVIGAALSPGFAGLYQIAIQLPGSLPAGDTLLKAAVGGMNTPDNVYLFIAP